jgi:hypothetical protein
LKAAKRRRQMYAVIIQHPVNNREMSASSTRPYGRSPGLKASRTVLAFPLSQWLPVPLARNRRTGQSPSYSAWGRSGISPASQLSLAAPHAWTLAPAGAGGQVRSRRPDRRDSGEDSIEPFHDSVGRGLAEEKAIGASRDCLFLCHPPRYEFMKQRYGVHLSMAVLSGRHQAGRLADAPAGGFAEIGYCMRPVGGFAGPAGDRGAIRTAFQPGSANGARRQAVAAFMESRRWLNPVPDILYDVTRRVAGENTGAERQRGAPAFSPARPRAMPLIKRPEQGSTHVRIPLKSAGRA